MATCYQKHPFEIETEDNLTCLNRKISEIKKKIQLSEGQRKSNYEESEHEKRLNTDRIVKLKKEIKERIQELVKAKSDLGGDAQFRLVKYLQEVGPIGNKNYNQLIDKLDQRVIDHRKQFDLLKYQRRQRKLNLKKLQSEYQSLLVEKNTSSLQGKRPPTANEKIISHLENEIHKVHVQWMEAEHIRKKYLGIRHSLLTDSVKFESGLLNVEGLIKHQNNEIKKLEAIHLEAVQMRDRAMAALSLEEHHLADAASQREREQAYFKQKFEERKTELEKLERRIFPTGRPTLVQQESVTSGDLGMLTEESSPVGSSLYMERIFKKLMQVTGVTQVDLVYERFIEQRSTANRLHYLRSTTEEEKKLLEKKHNKMMAEFETYKYAQFKDKEENQEQVEMVKNDTKAEIAKQQEYKIELKSTRELLLSIKKLFFECCLKIEPMEEAPLPEWTESVEDLDLILEVMRTRYVLLSSLAADAELESTDEILLPIPKVQDIQLSPRAQNQPTPSPTSHGQAKVEEEEQKSAPIVNVMPYKELANQAPIKVAVSDEEDEIPSRSTLKRQAQVLIDAKSRRKGFRIQQYPRK